MKKIEYPDDQDICANCGHKYLLHSGMSGDCDACDSPEIPFNKKCPGFKSKEK